MFNFCGLLIEHISTEQKKIKAARKYKYVNFSLKIASDESRNNIFYFQRVKLFSFSYFTFTKLA